MCAADCCGFGEARAGSVLFIMGRYAEVKRASAREGEVNCRSSKNKRGTVSLGHFRHKRSQKITSDYTKYWSHRISLPHKFKIYFATYARVKHSESHRHTTLYVSPFVVHA